MKKGKTRAGAKTVTRPVGEGVEAPPREGPVSAQHIARRAYELYLSRGQDQGSALDDWLQAERELSGKPRGALPRG